MKHFDRASASALPPELADRIQRAIYELAHELGRRLAASLENELTMGQFVFMELIAKRGSVSASELATKLCVKPSAVTAMLDRLEKRGLIARERGVGEDRRVVLVRLTDAGLAMLAECGAKRREITAELLAALTPEEAGQLAAILSKVGKPGGSRGQARCQTPCQTPKGDRRRNACTRSPSSA